MIRRFTSRKFLIALGGILTAIGAGLTGVVQWYEALSTIMFIVLGYLGVQGMVDYKAVGRE
ncbi:hypothetical protein LCGC14_1296030 [marine sediment metagenome]|uniref:Uncharacterized protein n=1 Tax=marine sediment metagenome TaxID=412755 RepID=A0A0F9KRC5_9ZZZZ|nr:hypothetical protein [bacterium]